MAKIGKSTFAGLYGNSGTTFPDNTNGEISEGDMRAFGQHIVDSIAFVDDIVPTDSTGTAIAFDAPRTYGISVPETGNITLNSSGLVKGVTQLIIHNHSSEPTFGSEFKIISGAYVTSEDNYIFCHAVSASLILVTISQEIS